MGTRRSIEYGGLGQSGYTAGRCADDAALERELATDYTVYPRGADEEAVQDQLGTDDRFTGRGGPDQYPEPTPPGPRAGDTRAWALGEPAPDPTPGPRGDADR